MRYLALLDGEAGAWGASFPDLPGCVAMGNTQEEAMLNASEALREFVVDAYEHKEVVPPPSLADELAQDAEIMEALRKGAVLFSVALVVQSGRPRKANMSIDEGILDAIDEEAKRRKLTRSSMVEVMARSFLEHA